MIHILEPLALIPGVRVAVLVTQDGVPVAMRGRVALQGQAPAGERRQAIDEDVGSLAGLATSWFDEVARAGGLLSWEPQRRAVLRAARGTIVMLGAPGAVLLVVLEPGASADELRLPMEAAVARMHRVLRNMNAGRDAARAPSKTPGPQGVLPQRLRNGSDGTSPESYPHEAPGEVGQIGN